jgi:hypothetical protein
MSVVDRSLLGERNMTEGRKLVERASANPATVRAMLLAFDDALAVLRIRYRGEVPSEDTKLRVALAVIANAEEYGDDAEALSRAAVAAASPRPNSRS